ncbi:hypothetical protein CHS0354_030579 [Potamilus streckersoni]|uniref:SH3 domain-containing protein n=1 Tax=Potamilus streckersoni TaxID=2493646 RepID=A0AAE0SD17_9BIVA|nr:hypothetical protein CHS0354_030579 [Potamilus streckersoni]
MEVYRAISDFNSPVVDGSENILSFKKGDEFEIYDCHKTSEDWWGARSLKDNVVGYVPSRYMQYEERKIGKLLPQDYNKQKEESLKRLSNMQKSPICKSPDNSYVEPEPDYNDDLDQSDQPVFPIMKLQTKDQSDVPIMKLQTKDQSDVPSMKLQTKDQSDALIFKPQHPPERKGSQSSEDGLKQSKKLQNPCVESPIRQALHKELLFNYKQGINVLQKPELSKVLQKRRETQRIKDWDEQKKVGNKRTSLELRLEERANKLKEEASQDMKPIQEGKEPELQAVHKKITNKSTGTAGAAVK